MRLRSGQVSHAAATIGSTFVDVLISHLEARDTTAGDGSAVTIPGTATPTAGIPDSATVPIPNGHRAPSMDGKSGPHITPGATNGPESGTGSVESHRGLIDQPGASLETAIDLREEKQASQAPQKDLASRPHVPKTVFQIMGKKLVQQFELPYDSPLRVTGSRLSSRGDSVRTRYDTQWNHLRGGMQLVLDRMHEQVTTEHDGQFVAPAYLGKDCSLEEYIRHHIAVLDTTVECAKFHVYNAWRFRRNLQKELRRVMKGGGIAKRRSQKAKGQSKGTGKGKGQGKGTGKKSAGA